MVRTPGSGPAVLILLSHFLVPAPCGRAPPTRKTTMRLSPKRPDHVNFEEPRGSNVSHLTEAMNGPIPETTAEEHQLMCRALRKRDLWHTDLPDILGLVERPRIRRCPQGHDQANHGGVRGNGRRYCMTCHRDYERARYQRNKATA